MRSSVSSLVAAATVLVGVVRADDFEIDDTVNAGEATSVELDFDSDIDDYYSSFPGVRIYLATTPPGWGTGPACYLINYTAIDTSGMTFDVTVPASALADGSDASLSYSFISEDGYSSDSYSYSNDFTLEGGTGDWSALELNGWQISSPDYCPCSAMECSRECSDKYYSDGDLTADADSDTISENYLDWYNCLSACPGTSYPELDTSDSDGGDDSSTSTGLQTSTQTASADGASRTTASSTSSSTSASSSKSTGSSTSTASATQTTTTTTATAVSGAGRTALTTTALLSSCLGMVSLWL